MEVYLGRQPILNLNEQVVAYELLYRNQEINSFPMVDSDYATLDVLVNTFVSFGIEEVAGGKPCFVNFTEKLILGKLVDYLDPSKVVIEILEDVPITEELIARIKELRSKGFKIALDDFIMQSQYMELYSELFEHINYIKIDFLLTSTLERMHLEDLVKEYYPHIQLLAEKVETREQFEIAVQSGYSLFQGYFFEQPQVLKVSDVPSNTIQYFQIISLLREDEPDINRIAENIEIDIALSYKLLQLINQSPKRNRSKIRSIKQAVVLVGLEELRKWVYLLAMRELPNGYHKDTYFELMRSSLYRGKMCEKLAKLNYEHNASEHFLVGLFSLIDTILQRPMHTILSQLPLSERIIDTLSGYETEFTPYLNISIAMDKSEFDSIDRLAKELQLSEEQISELQDEVRNWVKETFDEFE